MDNIPVSVKWMDVLSIYGVFKVPEFSPELIGLVFAKRQADCSEEVT